MSLDVELYSVGSVSLPELRASLPEGDAWTDTEEELVYEGSGWQVLVGEAEEVDANDVPADLRAVLPEARYLFPLTLEPIGAPDAALAFLERVFEAVGSTTRGVANDFRTGAPRRFGG